MTLPVSRNRTAVAGAEVSSDTVNDLQDGIIAIHAPHTTQLAAPAGNAGTTNWTFAASESTTAGQGDYWLAQTSGGQFLSYALPVKVGDRIVSASAWLLDSTFAMEVKLWKIDMTTGTQTQVGSTSTSAGNTTRQKKTVTPSSPEVVAAGFMYKLTVKSGSTPANQRCQGAEMVTDRITY